MKVAVSSSGKTVNSEVNPRFGRCPYFLIVEIENGKIVDSKSLENTATGHQRGAGPTAVELIANQGVEAVITQNIGPRALEALKPRDELDLKIEVYKGSGVIKEVVKDFIAGELEKIL